MITPAEQMRTLDKLNDASLVADVCAYVSCGNSLIDLCNIWQVTYHVVSLWLFKNHCDEYQAALKTRGEWIDQRVLDEIKSIGLVDIRQAYGDDGRLLDPKDWPDSLARAVAATESDPAGGITRIKMWDKLKALELLGRNRLLFAEDRPAGAVVQIFQHLGAETITVEERIGLIESALRNQIPKDPA